MADAKKQARHKKQVEIAEKLQDLVLEDFLNQLKAGTLSSTDRATLVRLLVQNGWTLDPATIPTDLKNKLTEAVSFDDDLPAEGRHLRAI